MLLVKTMALHQLSWNGKSLNNVRQQESALEISAENSQRKQVTAQAFHLCWRTGHISTESDLNREKIRNRSRQQATVCMKGLQLCVIYKKQTNLWSRTHLVTPDCL